MDKISFSWKNNCFCARAEDMKYKLLAEFYISDVQGSIETCKHLINELERYNNHEENDGGYHANLCYVSFNKDKVLITIEFNDVIYEKLEIEQADFRESLLKCIDFLDKGIN